jgi:hypothetical protein
MNTSPHVQRMLIERYELMAKVVSLRMFISGNDLFHALPYEEQRDMKDQLEYMHRYLFVLERRIHRADPNPGYQSYPDRSPNPQTGNQGDDLVTSTQEISDALASPTPTSAPAAGPVSGGGRDDAGAAGSGDSGSSGGGADSGSASSGSGD